MTTSENAQGENPEKQCQKRNEEVIPVLADMTNRHEVSESSTFELHRARHVVASFSKRCSGTVLLTLKFMVIMS